ncbi:phenylalanine--tRNA ligase subunit beta [Aeromicrobium sp. CTD01-1L150]|uniref:phenylalanine--tRNA ligase subunit beta n=1 Tax=Aeromicrobium sp. CTD01-1L150 TaxID=3341830 RepID=UPI0035C23522
MKVPVTWLRELTGLPADVSTEVLATRLTAYDLKLEEIIGAGVSGPLVVGRVLALEAEPQKNGKTINWCRVDVGSHNDLSVPDAPGQDVPSRGIVCGAHNFGVGDLVVVSLPGTYLAALGFEIGSRKTYGHVSDGMICSTRELSLPDDATTADGIVVLEPGSAEPGDDAITLLGLDEEVLDLEVNPDRAYALSMRGVGRDTALAFGLSFSDPAQLVDDPATRGEGYPVRVDDAGACPVFTARVVTGFDPSRPSPPWMVRRLEQAGMRSISLAVDVSNYVMLELGQPNHAYDRAKLDGPITVRRAAEGESLTTLDDVERTLDPADLLICDDSGPIGLAGVMGGASTEIDASTTDIVIEAAHFDPTTVFRTGRRHRLTSEAGKRNERGVDPELAAVASRRVAELLVEHGGGAIDDGLTVVGEAPGRRPVTISASLPARVSGVDIASGDVVVALEGNGCEVETDGFTITATPPSWRFDLVDAYDLVEEALRVVGYDQVPSVLPTAPGGRGLTRSQELRRRVGYVLAGAGLTEVKTFPFAGPADLDRLGVPVEDARRRQVLLENPLSAQEPGLTTTLLIGVLRALALNVGRGHEDVAISEVGRVFTPRPGAPEAPIYGVDRRPTPAELDALDAALPEQPFHAAWALAGQRERRGWAGPGRDATWADAIAVGRRLADALHVSITVEQAQHAPFHPGRCAAFWLHGPAGDGGPGATGSRVIGHAGELHPDVVRAHGLPERAVAGEIDLDVLLAAAPEVGPKPDFSAYPVVKEDLALVVADDVPAARVQQALEQANALVESVRLFDVYTGEQVGQNRRSLAFSLRLRARDRTLSETEISAARADLVAAAEAAGATLRT